MPDVRGALSIRDFIVQFMGRRMKRKAQKAMAEFLLKTLELYTPSFYGKTKPT